MIGGKVIDPSALVAHLRGSFAMASWLATARDRGLVLVIPLMALAEVQFVYPRSAARLDLLLGFPWVVELGLASPDTDRIDRLLAETNAWDGTAGHVILIARQRGWPVLTTDPDRILRIAPDLDTERL